jgi:uncharacterized protein
MLTFSEQQQFFSRRALHLILMPTEQCNFRCTYCYEDFTLGRMSPAVVAGIKALVQRRVGDLEFLCIEWFGGEPLLATETILEFQSWVCSLCVAHPKLLFSGQMTTNGFLLSPPLFRRLLSAEVRSYQISIDGPKENHDRQRVRTNGQGTFDEIWANLVAMREEPEPFTVLLRVHATKDNLASLKPFVARLMTTFGQDSRFRLSLRAVERLGGPNDRHLAVLDAQQVKELDSIKAAAGEGGLTIHPGPLAEPGALQGCYASAANSYVVRSNGELAKCTVALRHPENRVGVLHQDGSVALDSEKMLGWMRGVFSGDRETLACPMNGLVEPRPWGAPEAVPEEKLVRLGGARSV